MQLQMFCSAAECSRILLEFDDERSGGFEPLAKVPEDKKELVTSYYQETGLEDKGGSSRENQRGK